MANFLNEAFELFGFGYKPKEPQIERPSFQPKEYDDGAVVVAPAGAYGISLDLDGTVRSEAELITKYREMIFVPECDAAIDEIVNEAVSIEEDDPVKLILDDLDQPAKVKKAIQDCFQESLQLLNFKQSGYDVFRRWYIDGRLYFHVIIDEENTKDGVAELRYIDPRKIRKVREVVKKKVRGGEATASVDAVVTVTKNEYYVFTDKGFDTKAKTGYDGGSNNNGLRISKESIIYVTSGITDPAGSMVVSYLHKAIKPNNQLRMLEDAAVIYRLSRSSERRVWYIDIGNLPKMKAEQYVRDIMVKHKNKLVYDGSTGNVSSQTRFQTMTEDYWLPQRDGKGTKVDVLPAGTAFNQLDDIAFFQKKLYRSLNVPISRLDPENAVNVGIATEISRDEIKFGKFIARLRNRFSHVFMRILERQLVLKQVMSIEDFNRISKFFRFEFAQDNEFMELKEQQIMTARNQLVLGMMPLIGRYYSNLYIRKKILRQSDEDIEELDAEIAEETMDPQYNAGGEMGPGAEGMMVDTSAVDGSQDPNAAKSETNGAGQGGGPGKDIKPPPTAQEKQKNSAVRNTAKKLSKGT
jgi:hypothetical protein